MQWLSHTDLWVGIVKIVWIDIILSGDNAVVIALAARALPPAQQRKAIVLGCAAAVMLRVLLTMVAAQLLQLSFLQIAGGCLLLWIGYQLLAGGSEPAQQAKAPSSMWVAIRTILLADLVMCLDNVIAVAAAAQGSFALLMLGLAVSIPLVVFGSTLIIRLMDRFPAIVTCGAAVIGWVAGETIVGDRLLQSYSATHPWLPYAAAAAGVTIVVVAGRWRKSYSTPTPAA